MANQILKLLLNLVAAGGGAAVVAWAIFAKLGDSWLAGKFAKQLEQFRHEQTKEVEQLRHNIASLFSRISKIHEKEFEVLPTAWLKVHQAYGRIRHVTAALKQFPDLAAMEPFFFEAYVDSCKLPDVHKKKLHQIAVSERNDYYRNQLFRTELWEAHAAWEDLNNYLVMNQIFMTQSLWESFTEVNKLLKSVLIIEEIVNQNPHIPAIEIKKQRDEDLIKIEPLLAPLGGAIKERLHYEKA